jgi:hypothetical protein
VVGAPAVEQEVVQVLLLAPVGELLIRPRMLAEERVGVGLLAVPRVLLVSGMDEEDVALPDVHYVLYHLAGVHVVVADLVGDVGDYGVAHQFV